NNLRNKYYKACDLFVLPSKYILKKRYIEGFGIVFVEAGFFKLPSIGPYFGGVNDVIINGQTGFLINNIEELTEKIKIFLENPNIRKKMGLNAYQFVKNNFLMEHAYKRYLKAFRSVN
ncbi:MAG: glycosyltransferase, partial [Candidatus Helarchaeota archaeon]